MTLVLVLIMKLALILSFPLEGTSWPPQPIASECIIMIRSGIALEFSIVVDAYSQTKENDLL